MILLSEPRIVDNSVCSVKRKWNGSAPRTQNCRQFSPFLSEPRIVDNSVCSVIRKRNDSAPRNQNCRQFCLLCKEEVKWFCSQNPEFYNFLLLEKSLKAIGKDYSVSLLSLKRKWNDSALRTQNCRQFCLLCKEEVKWFCSQNPKFDNFLWLEKYFVSLCSL